MKTLTRIIVATAELAEAEGKSLRLSCARLAVSVCLAVLGAVALGVGCGLVVLSLYLVVAGEWGPWAGALVAGVLALAVGGIGLWTSRRAAR